MSLLHSPKPVFFFGSFLYRSDLYKAIDIEVIWKSKFANSIQFKHSFFPMKEYYSKEMGDIHLLDRLILVSTEPLLRDDLVNLKIWSDSLERASVTGDGNRTLNFDVGYISLENVVLATGKSFSHRIHLNSGVYAELTYFYEYKTFRIFPWTYPDYSHVDYVDFFNFSRSVLQKKI